MQIVPLNAYFVSFDRIAIWLRKINVTGFKLSYLVEFLIFFIFILCKVNNQ